MRAGKLRNPCVHQRKTKTGLDGHGQPIYRWDTIGVVWCSIDPIATRHAESARQVYPLATHEVRLRFKPQVKINDRLVTRTGKEFEIGHIGNLEERDKELKLLVSEGG